MGTEHPKYREKFLEVTGRAAPVAVPSGDKVIA
jgi:hypothetical protein